MEEKSNSDLVLLVDDDKFLRDMYALKLKEKGFTVETAEGGQEALEKLRGGMQPTLLIFDLVMPGVDGFEFLERMQEEKLVPDAKRIVLSNQGQDSDMEKAKALGATEYIVKANTIPSEIVAKVLALAKP